jgi:hypothetical protein
MVTGYQYPFALECVLAAQEALEHDAQTPRRQVNEAQQALARHEAVAQTQKALVKWLTPPPAPAWETPARSRRRKASVT